MKRLKISSLIIFCLVAVSHLMAQDAPTTEIKYLSGKGYGDDVQWDFYCTDGRKSGEWSKIHVPSCWELEGFGEYQYGITFYGKATDPEIVDEKGKYKHTFNVPTEWRGKRIEIVFDGAMTDTEVRINGRKAGPVHQGGFYRFKYDITDKLHYGEDNLLEVTVSKESEDASVNLAERRADYWNFGGIFRPVFLEIQPQTHIARTAIDATADGSFSAEVYLAAGAAEPLTVEAQLMSLSGKKIGKTFSDKTRPGAGQVVVKSQFDDVKLWTAETPNLYEVKFTLKNGEGEVLHTLTERTGFRTIEIREGDGVYVNGTRIIMKGINKHSFWPESGRTMNRELNYEDARLIKEMNMNTVRLSHYPSDPEFLEACDELGLYVMDELGGWHGRYDEGIGRKLVGEVVRRDVNHPSIIFWNNGNEGGWNPLIDDEFAKWDPQNRPVLHPQQDLSGLETMHYRSYGETEEYLRGELIFFPTEFLHGLYDGGHGAGLNDYWEMMRTHPRCAGGLLWVYADEGVVRTDQDGRIDTQGNFGADGIIGPHHEKEGSFFTVKEIWSPVQVMTKELKDGFNGQLDIENRYDFTNLNQCKFSWELASYAGPQDKEAGYEVIKSGSTQGPDLAPRTAGQLSLNLPGNWQEADALYLTATDPAGDEIWTWSWKITPFENATPDVNAGSEVKVKNSDGVITVNAGDCTYLFDNATGYLTSVNKGDQTIELNNGPRFIAARRGDRTVDGSVDPNAPDDVDRIYNEIEVARDLKNISMKSAGQSLIMTMDYFGALDQVVWQIFPDGQVKLDYTYRYDGVVELMGVRFDYPEDKMQSMKWLGEGPYRVWQNRIKGTKLDVWEKDYNDPVPGETFTYPEFKGYFAGWQWAQFQTEEGKIFIGNADQEGSYLGVYRPRDGRDAVLYTLPESGLSVLDVIPAVRNKVNATDLVGPSSQAQRVRGDYSHTVHLRFAFEE